MWFINLITFINCFLNVIYKFIHWIKIGGKNHGIDEVFSYKDLKINTELERVVMAYEEHLEIIIQKY